MRMMSTESLTYLSITTIGRRSVVDMQKNVVKLGKRNVVFRFFLSKADKDKIVAWNQDLARVLHVFNVRSIGSVNICELSSSVSDRVGYRYKHKGYGYPNDGCEYSNGGYEYSNNGQEHSNNRNGHPNDDYEY